MTRILSNRSRRILASCSGISLLFILLLLASLEGGTEVERPPKIHMHDVQMYKPPPPPPPPPMEQNIQRSPMPSMTKAYAEDPVKLDIMPLEVDMEAIAISGFGTGGPGGGGGLGDGWGNWGTVALPELDKIPIVISHPPLGYPPEVEDQGVLEFRVRLHIIIDEEGRTYPVRILRNPFPSVNKEILEFASEVLFTPPTKQGVPVRAEYEWPLLINKP